MDTEDSGCVEVTRFRKRAIELKKKKKNKQTGKQTNRRNNNNKTKTKTKSPLEWSINLSVYDSKGKKNMSGRVG